MNSFSVMRVAGAALLATSSLAALADEPSYTYAEVGAGWVDLDVSGVSTKSGYFGGFSAEFTDSIYATASFEEYDYDFFDLQIIKAGIGYRLPMNDRTDLNFELAYNELDVEVADTDGVRGTVGVRSRNASNFETRAYAGYVADSDNGSYVLGVEGSLLFTDNIGLTVQFETYEFDINLGRVGLRFMF